MRVLYFVANGFAATLDWVMGVFIVWALGQMWPYELAWYHYVLGAFLGLAPDFDFVHRALFAKKGEGLTDHHDSLMHRPYFGIPCAAVLGLFLGGDFWVFGSMLPVFAHYLHDTRGLGGGGIAWLWPLSPKHVGISLRGPFVTGPREAKELWPDHNKWLEREYMRPSFRSLTELSISSVLLGVVVGSTSDLVWGVLVVWWAWYTAIHLWLGFQEMEQRRNQSDFPAA